MKTHYSRRLGAIVLAIIVFTSSAQAVRFEYKVVFMGGILLVSDSATTSQKRDAARQLQLQLNNLGSDGWELVQIDSAGYATFKKTIP